MLFQLAKAIGRDEGCEASARRFEVADTGCVPWHSVLAGRKDRFNALLGDPELLVFADFQEDARAVWFGAREEAKMARTIIFSARCYHKRAEARCPMRRIR